MPSGPRTLGGVRAGTCSDSESSDVGNGIDEACAEGELQSARAHAVQQQLACSCRAHCRADAAAFLPPGGGRVRHPSWVQQLPNRSARGACARTDAARGCAPRVRRLSRLHYVHVIQASWMRVPVRACALRSWMAFCGTASSATHFLQFAAALRSVLNAPPGALERLIASQETALCAQRARGAGGGQGAQQFGGGEANQTRATGSAATYNVARPLCRLPNPELEEIVKADMRQDHPRSALPRSYPWNSLNPQDPTLVRRAAGEHVAVFNYGLHMLAGLSTQSGGRQRPAPFRSL